uniref:Uncharacterized protein n=1 Tax=Lepeophtheirus salmonis TaxID=72036 RepID=A0A0K2UWQ3_LEPSM
MKVDIIFIQHLLRIYLHTIDRNLNTSMFLEINPLVVANTKLFDISVFHPLFEYYNIS